MPVVRSGSTAEGEVRGLSRACEKINRGEKESGLAGCPSRILCDHVIGGKDDEPVNDGLTNEHSIKRVFIVLRQGPQVSTSNFTSFRRRRAL